MEAEWEQRLRDLTKAEVDLQQKKQQATPPIDRDSLLALGTDLDKVWSASTTTDRDRKSLLRCLFEEVIIAVDRDQCRADLTLRWKGSMLTKLQVSLPRSRPVTVRTDEDTIDLVRRLAVYYPDAGILNRQGRKTAKGLRFIVPSAGSLRRYWKTPRFILPKGTPKGDVVNVHQAARIFGMAPSTFHRWLNDGFIAGEQITPGAPWQIRLTDDLKCLFVDQPPDGYLCMRDAMEHDRACGGLSRPLAKRLSISW